MTKQQIYSYLVNHCVKKDVAHLVAESTVWWREGNKKSLSRDGNLTLRAKKN